MLRTIRTFLDTRDLLALSQTCASMREFVAPQWEIAIRAKFPRKKFAPHHVMMPPARLAYKFLLNLESRVASAPPHGNAHMFFASLRGPEQCAIQCETARKWVTRYVTHPDLMVRGDIIVDGNTNTYIFDGVRGRLVARAVSDFEIDMIDLSFVFCIPFEFHITYYDFMDIDVKFRVNQKVAVMRDGVLHSFAHNGDTYTADCRDGDDLQQDIDDAVEFIRRDESTALASAGHYMIVATPEMTND